MDRAIDNLDAYYAGGEESCLLGVLAMGGNVQHSMNITRYKKTPPGFVAADGEAMMLMVNNG